MVARIQIDAPLHIAFLVRDLSRAESFYGDLLGLAKVDRSANFPGVWYQMGAFQLHLIVAQDWQPPLSDAQKWGRNPHLAFAVADLEKAQEQLQAAGYAVQMSTSGRAALFTQDPDGHVIEMSQSQAYRL